MTRGNQRDLNRAKAQKKAAERSKGQIADGTPAVTRMARDAEIMRQKQQAAEQRRAQEQAAAASAPKKK